MKTAKQIREAAQEVIAMITDNQLEAEFAHEIGVATEVVEQIAMDSGRAQREYLTAEYFLHGSFTVPGIRKAVANRLKKLGKVVPPVPVDVTPLEAEVLQNIVESEYRSEPDPVDYPVFSFSVTNETKRLAGALGTCIRKGLAGGQRDANEDPICWITAAGLEVLNRYRQANGKPAIAA